MHTVGIRRTENCFAIRVTSSERQNVLKTQVWQNSQVIHCMRSTKFVGHNIITDGGRKDSSIPQTKFKSKPVSGHRCENGSQPRLDHLREIIVRFQRIQRWSPYLD